MKITVWQEKILVKYAIYSKKMRFTPEAAEQAAFLLCWCRTPRQTVLIDFQHVQRSYEMDNLLYAIGGTGPQSLPAAQPGQNVWPKQSCPSFMPRTAVMAGRMRECWYCKYADFHLTEPVALEVGICCFPIVQSR